MRPDEALAAAKLAGDAAGGLTGRIHDMHAGIAARVFDSIGDSAKPVRVVHDGIARGVYSGVAAALRTALTVGGTVASASISVEARSIESTTRGRLAIGALNGAFGDTLGRGGNRLALPMSVRAAGRAVALSRAGLAEAFPRAQPRIAVFIHGLCETEDSWNVRADRHVPYGYRLDAELGFTPVYVRYNSGRHISENGRDLDRLLSLVVEAWPVEVHEIVLIGHSMGGLVARSACHYGVGAADWVSSVRHVFTLCSPHLGAPLEQGANVASVALAALPETRGFANALNLRSAGIKDLRYGYLLDEDWFEQDVDAFLRNTGRQIPFLATAKHYFISATLSRDPRSRSARLIGDLLVLGPSAWAHGARAERMMFPVDHYRHVGGVNHFAALNHPAVYGQIRRWLMARKALPAPVCEGP
jgi:pimeloyl-ACP methyl ester carboxylesterase